MDYILAHLAFFIGSFFVPAALLLFNFVVRKVKRWRYTAASDFLLLLMTTSLSFAVMADDISPLIQNLYLRKAAGAIFIFLFICILLSWYLAVAWVEPKIDEAVRQGSMQAFRFQGRIFLVYAMAVIFTGAEFSIFCYR
ncbi:MAG: hypothetical protein WA876_07940 [Candidatus Acidiferrales bacterium]